MMRTYFECHVTFLMHEKPEDRETIPVFPFWKFSKIDGDPVLGDGVKCYLTRQFRNDTPIHCMVDEMKMIQRRLEQSAYFQVLRLKIEDVVYDTKQDKVVL